MAKSKRGGGRRSRHEDSDDEYNSSGDGDGDDDNKNGGSSKRTNSPTDNNNNNNNNNLDFKQRRELQRKASADKRRSKMKCHLCGKSGHVRRECPGIADDGRGESKYTKSKGDAGSTHLKGSSTTSTGNSSSNSRGAKNRGRKKSGGNDAEMLQFPDGFDPNDGYETLGKDNDDDDDDVNKPYRYYDCCCDGASIIDYLRHGRGKAKQTAIEASSEYGSAIAASASSSNYGGCITRSYVKPGRPWNTKSVPALTAFLDAGDPRRVFFVVGLSSDFLREEEEEDENSGTTALMEAISSSVGSRVVGVFCDLDYSPNVVAKRGFDRESQLRRLRSTCQAAIQAGVPIQIRTSPAAERSRPIIATTAAAAVDENKQGHEKETETTTNPYSEVIRDLAKILLETTSSTSSPMIHLSSWSGKAEHMSHLLRTFPNCIYVGLNATVSFSKATISHECAFDVPLDKILLETCSPSIIPSIVTKALGRDAYCHSGLIPFVALAIAERKSAGGCLDTTAEDVARASSVNAIKLYPQLAAAAAAGE